MLIAVASKDGREINQHFGHAERFLIYEVAVGRVMQVGEILVDKYCSFDPEHPLRGHVLREIAAQLDGCAAIACAMVGQAPQEEMARLGMPVFAVQGPIEPTLKELSKLL